MEIKIIDIIVGALLAYGLVHGYYKGIVQQLGALGGLIVAILFANLFAPLFENLLNRFDIAGPRITHQLAYLISFLVLLFGCNFLARLLKKTLHILHLGWFDRIAGSRYCCFKYLLITSVLLNLYTLLGGKDNIVPPVPQEARLCQVVMQVAPFVIDWSNERVTLPDDIHISLPEINKDDIPAFLQ